MIYTFGDYQLDTALFELRWRGDKCAAQPKPLDLLIMLVEHRDRVVTKSELLRQLWPGVVVSDNAVAQAIACAREMLQESSPSAIASVRGRGYRFVLPVQERSSDTIPRVASVIFEADDATTAREHLAGLERLGLTVFDGRDAASLSRMTDAGKPAVVFVEHLERIDPLALTLFVALARSAAPGLMLVGTCCFEALEGPAKTVLVPLRRERRRVACG